MIIHVTQKDIKLGKHFLHNCPVARAINRDAGMDNIKVMADEITTATFYLKGTNYHVPKSVTSFVRKFDSLKKGDGRKNVKPFNFILRELKDA